MKPTQEQIAFFKENGYLNVGPALTPAELETARIAYDRIFGATDKPASYRNLGQQEGEEVSKGAVLQIIDMWRLDSIFEQLLHKEELLDIIEGLMGHSNIRLYHDQAQSYSTAASCLGDALHACRHEAKRRILSSAPPPPRAAPDRMSH